MISPLGATKLAYTKLKTRRLRLAISLTIVSLLFSILIAAVIVQAGFFASFNKFSSEGLSGRYIVAGIGGPVTWGETFGLGRDLTLLERAETLQDTLIKQKTARAEELGLEYNPEWDTAVSTLPDGSKHLRLVSGIGEQVVAEQRKTLRPANEESFKQQLDDLNPKAIYNSVQSQIGDDNLVLIKDGKEPTAAELADFRQKRQGFGGITQPGIWQIMDSELLNSFIFENQSLDIGEDGSIPVVAPSYAIEQELGLSLLAADASPEQKRERLETLRSQASGMTFEICYRNQPSLDLFKKAVGQQSDEAANGDKEDYVKPDLLYGLPETPCTAPVIESDTRDEAEKEVEANWQIFNRVFDQPEPVSQLLKLRVVGIKKDYNPDNPSESGGNFTPEQIFDAALNSNTGYGWITPLSVKEDNTSIAAIFKQRPGSIFGEQTTYFAEFSSADDAKQALLDKTCATSYGNGDSEEKGLLGTKIENTSGTVDCSRDGRQFSLQPFGSNSIAIDQFKSLTQRTLLLAAAVVAIIAAVVLMGMVGRIIADSRKETAIFRALGATRLSIIQVYFTYTGLLVIWIASLSMLFGFATAYIFNSIFSPDFSVAAAVAFSVKDLSQQFTFLGLNWANLGLIILVVIAASYLAATIPILRSVRRNPMADMREE